MKPKLSPPQCLGSELVCSEFGKLSKDTLQLPGKEPYHYFKHVSTPYACMALPFFDDDHLVLNFEYRHPVGEFLLSCPGGLVEEGEDPKLATQRELLEETGYSGEETTLIGESYPFPGLSSQKIFFYMIKSAKLKSAPQRERAELIETDIFSLSDVEKHIAQGEPTDGMLVQALYFWKRRK